MRKALPQGLAVLLLSASVLGGAATTSPTDPQAASKPSAGAAGEFPRLAERVARASVIVRVKVAGVGRTDFTRQRGIGFVDVRFELVRLLAGKASDKAFTVTMAVPVRGIPAEKRYKVGQEIILFLDQAGRCLGADFDVPPKHALDDVEKSIAAVLGKAVARRSTVKLPPPGAGEVRLEQPLEGGRVNRRVDEDGWVYIGQPGLYWRWTGGKYLRFWQEDVRIYVSADGRPRHLAGIRFRSPDDLPAVAAALKAKEAPPHPLILWCECPLPKGFAALPNQGRIGYLRRLGLRGNQVKFSDLSGLVKLTGLRSLDLSGCDFTDLRPLAKLTKLKSLDLDAVSSRPRIRDIRPLAKLTELESLNLRYRRNLGDLSPLGKLAKLESLNLAGCQIPDLTPLAQLTSLKWLDVSGGRKFADISPLAKLTELEFLRVSLFDSSIADLSPLAKLTRLKRLELSWFSGVSDLTPLTKLRNLRRLALHRFTKLTDISPLAKLTKLESLILGSCERISDIKPLAKLGKLKELSLCACRGVTDLSPLANLTELTELSLMYCTKATDIAPLSQLSKLRTLSLEYCKEISDLRPLSNLTGLKSLYLNGCESVSDLGPLHAIVAGGAFVRVDAHLTTQLEQLRESSKAPK